MNFADVCTHLNLEKEIFIDINESDKQKILDAFRKANTTSLPVIRENRIAGILDLFLFMLNFYSERSIEDLMKTDITALRKDDDISCYEKLEQDILPLLDNNGLYLGFIRREEIECCLKVQKSQEMLEDKYIKQIRYYKDLDDEYAACFESSYDGIFVTDGEGNILRLNKACERIEGVKAAEIVGKNMKDLVESGVYSNSVTFKVLEKRAPVTLLQTSKNGKEIMVTGTPIFKKGEIIRVVTNSRDITELSNLRKELRDAQQKTELFESELELLRQKHTNLGNIIVRSTKMTRLIELAVRVAAVNSTILIEGESGVGKEVVSKLIHHNSRRSSGPFIKIDCSAIPETLLESELFGYEKGAFTGANKSGKIGLIELANNGTLFLDEIGELPLNLQVKLLRVLQDREIFRIGGETPIPVDIRIIAATNKDLQAMVAQKAFREDLYYRLNVVPLFIPPLRERKEDIQPLVMNFLDKFNKQYDLNKSIEPEVMNYLLEYNWPGNVRELENIVERLLVTTNGDTIETEDLPAAITSCVNKKVSMLDIASVQSLNEEMDKYEKHLLQGVISRAKSTREMADILKIDPSTIRRKLKKHKIEFPF